MKRPRSFSWDEDKNASNRAKHGVAFEDVEKFDFETALVAIDDRRDYGGIREVAFGLLGSRVHTLVFTMRMPVCHVISFRKSNGKDIDTYVQHL